MSKNTMPETFDENISNTKEDILMNESDILRGLIGGP